MTRQDELDRKVIGNCRGLAVPGPRRASHLPGSAGRRRRAAGPPGARAARPGQAPVRRHVGHDGERGTARGQEPGRRARWPRSSSRVDIPESNVIVETLERNTDGARRTAQVGPALGAAIDAGLPPTSRRGAAHAPPCRLGRDAPRYRVVRGRPALAAGPAPDGHGGRRSYSRRRAGATPKACRKALRDLLLVSSLPEIDRTKAAGASERSFFAFKLHQFISGAGHAYATLERPGQRVVTVDGQQFPARRPEEAALPGALLPRLRPGVPPGQARHRDRERRFLARDIDDAPIKRDRRRCRLASAGHGGRRRPTTPRSVRLPHAPPAGRRLRASPTRTRTTRRPGSSATPPGNLRLKPHFRKAPRPGVPRGARRARSGSGQRPGSCPASSASACAAATTQSSAARDRNRLASLSAEGRSSATTVLVASALRWMHGAKSGLEAVQPQAPRLHRQPTGRGPPVGPLQRLPVRQPPPGRLPPGAGAGGPGGLRSDQLGEAQQRALGFDKHDPRDPGGVAARAVAAWRSTSRRRRRRCATCSPTVSGSTSGAAGGTPTRTWSSSASSRWTTSGSRSWPRTTSRSSQDAPDVLKRAKPATRQRRLPELFDHLRKLDGDPEPGPRADRRGVAHRPVALAASGCLGASVSTNARAGRAGCFCPRRRGPGQPSRTRTSSCAAGPVVRSGERCATRTCGTATMPSARSRRRSSMPSCTALLGAAMDTRSCLRGGHALRRPARLAARGRRHRLQRADARRRRA